MKLAREKDLQGFFNWMVRNVTASLQQDLEDTLLRYALRVEGNLDLSKILAILELKPILKRKTMSIHDQLIAQGEAQGAAWASVQTRIQSLEEFLEYPVTSAEKLKELSIEDMKVIQEKLEGEYSQRFKR